MNPSDYQHSRHIPRTGRRLLASPRASLRRGFARRFLHRVYPPPAVRYNRTMPRPRIVALLFLAGGVCSALSALAQAQPAPHPSAARMLIVPRRIVSGERATLAVLDVNGRLTPGVAVDFSNGDRVVTDATGRAMFVAPLNPGVIFAAIAGREGRVPAVILAPAEASSEAMIVTRAPRAVSLTDRFEISGKGFCGDADANQITVNGRRALVLASSPASVIALPPEDLEPGAAAIQISCKRKSAMAFSVVFVGLQLDADTAPIKRGERRVLTVRATGTREKLLLEARNLEPAVAELSGGNVVRQASSGGTQNTAKFEVVGKENGSFLVSIRLLPATGPPRPAEVSAEPRPAGPRQAEPN